MAFNHANVLLLAALLVVAAVGASAAIPHIPRATPPPPPPPILKGLSVAGRLCCSPTGNCPGKLGPVGAATATLSCTNNCDGEVGRDEVDQSGRFNISIPSSETLNFTSPFIPCFVTIQLPTLLDGMKCEALSNTTGFLVSGVRSTGTGYLKSLGGLVQEGTITGFTKYSS